MDDDRKIIIGGPPGAAVRGSRRYNCVQCGGAAWIAPSGQERIASDGLEVMCMTCGFALMQRDPEHTVELANPEKVRQEIEQHFADLKRAGQVAVNPMENKKKVN